MCTRLCPGDKLYLHFNTSMRMQCSVHGPYKPHWPSVPISLITMKHTVMFNLFRGYRQDTRTSQSHTPRVHVVWLQVIILQAADLHTPFVDQDVSYRCPLNVHNLRRSRVDEFLNVISRRPNLCRSIGRPGERRFAIVHEDLLRNFSRPMTWWQIKPVISHYAWSEIGIDLTKPTQYVLSGPYMQLHPASIQRSCWKYSHVFLVADFL